MKRLQTFALTLVCVCFAAGTAVADVLVLQTGERERGVIVQEGPEGYWLQTGERMKVLYAPDEVASIERESANINTYLREKWTEGTLGARPEEAVERPTVAPSAAPAPRGAAADRTDELEPPEEPLPTEERYGFIRGGGFVVGATTQADVRDVLGNPDKSTKDGEATVWIYEVGDDDVYTLSFERQEKKGVVLVHALYVSDYSAQERREQAEKTFKAIEGHQ